MAAREPLVDRSERKQSERPGRPGVFALFGCHDGRGAGGWGACTSSGYGHGISTVPLTLSSSLRVKGPCVPVGRPDVYYGFLSSLVTGAAAAIRPRRGSHAGGAHSVAALDHCRRHSLQHLLGAPSQTSRVTRPALSRHVAALMQPLATSPLFPRADFGLIAR